MFLWALLAAWFLGVVLVLLVATRPSRAGRPATSEDFGLGVKVCFSLAWPVLLPLALVIGEIQTQRWNRPPDFGASSPRIRPLFDRKNDPSTLVRSVLAVVAVLLLGGVLDTINALVPGGIPDWLFIASVIGFIGVVLAHLSACGDASAHPYRARVLAWALAGAALFALGIVMVPEAIDARVSATCWAYPDSLAEQATASPQDPDLQSRAIQAATEARQRVAAWQTFTRGRVDFRMVTAILWSLAAIAFINAGVLWGSCRSLFCLPSPSMVRSNTDGA